MKNEQSAHLCVRQMIRFGLVGGLNTALSYVVYWLLLSVRMQNTIAWGMGYVVGMGCSFVLNKQWTFTQRSKARGMQIVRFVGINLVALGVSTGMLAVFTHIPSISDPLAGVLATPFSMAVNFLGNKLWVFDA
ncbi:MAG: GtrA family protein [Clostridia bacterium]